MSLAEIKKQVFLDLLGECGVEVTITPYSPRPSKTLLAHRMMSFSEDIYEAFSTHSAKRIYRVLASEITFEIRNSIVNIDGSEFDVTHSHLQDDDNIILFLYVQ